MMDDESARPVVRDAARRQLPFDLGYGRPRASVARRLRRVLVVLVSVAILMGTVGGWAAYTYFDRKINRVAIGDLGENRPAARKGATTFLLVGVDSGREGTGAGDVGGMRSDTTILAHVGADDKVTLISFPRDMFVLVPEHTENGKVRPPTENKFNSAITVGGPTLLVKMVERLTRVRIDHYLMVDLAGFRKISEVIGGVDVCIAPWDKVQTNKDEITGKFVKSRNTDDPFSRFKGGPGHIQISGDQALAFVRQRYGLPDWDIDRTKRQQYFLSRVLAKVNSSGLLSSPTKVRDLLGAVGGALILGESTQPYDLTQLATRLHGISDGSLGTRTVPTHPPTRAEGAIDNIGSLSTRVGAVQLYKQTDLDALFTPMAGAPDTTGPANARVTVVNGSGTAGIAAKAVRDLNARGISAESGGNAPGSYKKTWIRYGTGAEATARSALDYLPDARLVSDSDVDGVQVIVGSTFDGVTDPPAAPAVQALAAPATPTTTGSAEPPPTSPPTSTGVAPEPPASCVY